VTHSLAPANARVHAYHEGRGDDMLDVIFYSGSFLVPYSPFFAAILSMR
jgi:hypothetical protein